MSGLIEMPKGVHVVYVVGNIAAGKSTVGRLISQEFRRDGPMRFVEEPTGEWNFAGVDMLRLLYSKECQNEQGIDAQTIAAMFQVMTFVTRVLAVDGAAGRCGDRRPVWMLLDRTVSCDQNVFSLNFTQSGVIKPAIGGVLQAMWNLVLPRLGFAPEVVLYTWSPADMCHRRHLKRDRIQEAESGGIPMEYFGGLQMRYNTWLLGSESMPDDVGFDGTGPYTVTFEVHNYETRRDETVHVPLVVLDCTREGEPRSPNDVYEITVSVASLYAMARKLGRPPCDVRAEDLERIGKVLQSMNGVLEAGATIGEVYGRLEKKGFGEEDILGVVLPMEERGLMPWSDPWGLAPGARRRLAEIIQKRIERQGGSR